jgi:hypothetical protein
MSKNKKEQKDISENINSQAPGENSNNEAEKNGRGGDISSIKFNQIFIALGVCITLMVIAKLMGL